MDCSDIREAISAHLDEEPAEVPPSTVELHVAGCAACAAWTQRLAELHRHVRLHEAEPVPDLTAAILDAAPHRPVAAKRSTRLRGRPFSTARWALLTVALTQLVLAIPGLLFGESAGAGVHIARELGSFDVALAVGLLVAAWQPARAWGLLPLAAALVLFVGFSTVLDLVDGTASGGGEAHHLLDVAGVALLSVVAREAGAPPLRRNHRAAT
jgi:predicted anti-sigma-YlaC factor YlaD